MRRDEIESAIVKLGRRMEELTAFDVSSIGDKFDPRLEMLDQKIDSTLVEIFGSGTVEYERYRTPGSLQYAALNAESSGEAQRDFDREIRRHITILNGIVESLKEKLQSATQTPHGRATRALNDLNLHPEILRAAGPLFMDGHYANAVEDACKALEALVKLRSGRDDLSGTPLMQTVFSANSPILRFNDLQTQSDRDEQQGMMYLFSGVVLALRNPRAHAIVKDDPEQSIESIGIVSMLAKSLDRAKRQASRDGG